MVKVALIGIGGMGSYHFQCYENIGNAEVIAVCEVRTEMAREKLAGKNIRIYESYDELLKQEKPDIIDICTPSCMHCEMSIKALEAGINVLCEKPMSLSSAECETIGATAAKSGKLFMTAHVVRFMIAYIHLANVIKSHELGAMLRLDMKRISEVPRWSWENWMLDLNKSGGTPLDLLIHDVDFVRDILGEPKNVSGIYHKFKNDNDFVVSELAYDNCAVTLEAAWFGYNPEFKSGYTAVFENGILEFTGEKVFKNGTEVALETGEVSKCSGINITSADGYAAEIRHFIDCVETNSAPRVSPESSRASVKLCERILENSELI